MCVLLQTHCFMLSLRYLGKTRSCCWMLLLPRLWKRHLAGVRKGMPGTARTAFHSSLLEYPTQPLPPPSPNSNNHAAWGCSAGTGGAAATATTASCFGHHHTACPPHSLLIPCSDSCTFPHPITAYSPHLYKCALGRTSLVLHPLLRSLLKR